MLRQQLMRPELPDVCPGGLLSVSAPGLQLHNATVVTVRRRVDRYPNLAGGNRRHEELAPHLVVASHRATGNGHPIRAVPVFNLKLSHPVGAEGLRQGRLDWIREIVLQCYHVDLIDALQAIEINLDPVAESSGRAISPEIWVATFTITIVNFARRII